MEGRWPSAMLTLAALGLLAVGLALTPDPRGHGTHEQLGLPPCRFRAETGIPCPTCGVTTAFAEAAHGHWIRASLTQPCGALIGTFAFAIPILFVASFADRRFDPSGLLLRVGWVRLLIVFLLIGLASWLYVLFRAGAA